MFTKIIVAIMSFVVMFSSLFGLNFIAPSDEAEEVKNVIIMIGDGMGFNHLYATEYTHGVKLQMLNRMEYYGSQQTASSSSPVTDSAAGGTALATGGRTINSYVGVYPTDPLAAIAEPASITDVAMKYGKATGIVTSDSIMGATPSSFSAHVRNRDLADEIFDQQVVSGIDLIWGGAAPDIVTEERVNENGKVFVDTLSEVQALELGQKSIGQFDTDAMWTGEDNGTGGPSLSELAVEAIDILSQDEDGFFMMIEGAHIDKRSHDRDGEGAMKAVLEFDKTVGAVLDFAEKDGNTLVIITADHETGGVTRMPRGNYKWLIGSHTGADVPCFVYGADSVIAEDETIKNTDIPDRAVAYMTNNEQVFPCPLAYLNEQ
ncbi:MAG: alkaline phosphatase [Clostridia bacterium]|nr:alkaline phosphatase [Clostridia bacterium]